MYSNCCVPDASVVPPQRAGVSERQVSSVWDAALPNALTLSPVLGRDNTTVLVGTDSTLVCIKISDGRSSTFKDLVCVCHALWYCPRGYVVRYCGRTKTSRSCIQSHHIYMRH